MARAKDSNLIFVKAMLSQSSSTSRIDTFSYAAMKDRRALVRYIGLKNLPLNTVKEIRRQT